MSFKNRPDGNLYYICGASRTGKTVYTTEIMKKLMQNGLNRWLVWDIERDYYELSGFVTITNLADLKKAILHKPTGDLKIAYQPRSLADFGGFCQLGLLWGELAPIGFVAEELADVTTPAKAPDGWGQLVRRGMKRGIEIFAITQRPAEADKTALGNAKFITTFYAPRARDRQYMETEMDLEAGAIAQLPKLHYIARDVDNRKNKKGKLIFAT